MTDRPSTELEHEAERIRSEIADTADRLRDRLSLNELLGEATRYLREADLRPAWEGVRSQVRANPVALGLIGAGIAWLAFGGGAGGSPRPPEHGERGLPRWRSGSGYDYVGDAHDSGAGMADRAREAGAGVAERAREAARHVGETAGSLHESAAESGRRLADASYRVARRGGSGLVGAIERESLLVAGFAAAIGAALGAALPSTRVEERHLGEVRSRLADGAAQAVEAAGSAAERAYAAARSAAEEEGLIPGERLLAERVEHVAEAAATAAEEELKSALGPGEGERAQQRPS